MVGVRLEHGNWKINVESSNKSHPNGADATTVQSIVVLGGGTAGMLASLAIKRKSAGHRCTRCSFNQDGCDRSRGRYHSVGCPFSASLSGARCVRPLFQSSRQSETGDPVFVGQATVFQLHVFRPTRNTVTQIQYSSGLFLRRGFFRLPI